jgi:50S ribosomal protein L16 3-hydroxylase
LTHPPSPIEYRAPTIPDTLLGDLTPETFLRDYWQQQPLLVRGALPDFPSPLAPDELAGLACEDDVTARLILEQGGRTPWEMRYGPFDADDFMALPETHWTLLVQEVDRLIPAVADLLDAFRFVPNWRIDDVQISYAPEHGTVGPHVDSYDVFLIQALGHRRWQIGYDPVPEMDEAFVPDLDVRLLKDFEADAEWVVGPGDLLYLPPRLPHYGVALDDCMTYSVGFRAPAPADLLPAFLTDAAERLSDAPRYRDPGLRRPEHPGRIDADALARIRRMLRQAVQDDDALDRWFARYVTTPGRGSAPLPPEEPVTTDELAEALRDGARLRRSAVADFVYLDRPSAPLLVVGGTEYLLTPTLAFAAPLLTGPTPLTLDALTSHLDADGFLSLLADLVNAGHLWVAE